MPSYIVLVVHDADVAILYGRHLLMVMTEKLIVVETEERDMTDGSCSS